MTDEQISKLLEAQRVALDAHRWAMPQERDVTPADQALWDATQAAVWAMEDALRALRAAPTPPAAPPSELVTSLQREHDALLANDGSHYARGFDSGARWLLDRVRDWTPAAPPTPETPTASGVSGEEFMTLCRTFWDLQFAPGCWCNTGDGNPHSDACVQARRNDLWLQDAYDRARAAALAAPVGETPEGK